MKERLITHRAVGAMLLNTSGIELVRVEGPFIWLADRDEEYRNAVANIEALEVEWYLKKNHNPHHRDGYVRVWDKGEPCPYEENEYDLIYAEDFYEGEE
jgi:hypothetical protein